MLPQSVKLALWSYDTDKIDAVNDSKLVISQVLNFGTKEATDWIMNNYGKSKVRNVALSMSMERYKAIPPGGNRFDLMRNRPDITPACRLNKPTGTTDVMGRLWWDRPSATIRTEFFKPEKGRYLHPTANRVISHREAARLQSFPDWFEFEGSKIEIARQIGNAVPPQLAKAIALHLAALLGRQPR